MFRWLIVVNFDVIDLLKLEIFLSDVWKLLDLRKAFIKVNYKYTELEIL